MLTFPNAKINIGLNIVEKRSDGFHNIESVFYPVEWCDALEILPNQDQTANEAIFQSTGLSIPGNESSNLCLKAWHLLQDQISTPPTIHLHKVIPMGAGLGGGSADGAFTLRMLNEVYQLNLSNDQLKDFARKLGSDCAFFIENKPVFCYNKGDEFEDFSLNLKGKFIVLVNPDIHISTAEAYSGVSPQKPEISLKTALSEPISNWKTIVKNDFEEKLLLKYPTIAEVKESLYVAGAVYASMTGSGSTVYGIFENEIDLKNQFPNFAIWQGFFKV
ncbi:4-diphosphocytidyl-2-C-methyl-D-erythritolkinase [Emticicia oligotrophica DSM 17448]|uniref:4-diphosphocytidyl-2-C-methyl-D-erythritol kinase n=1 Tax=Emticicia oligotrophica (strain DSM 17448 / CIP 109782 / MTCC 6937 / GPTSA100-15) TaxID=929562 RepID=A0ABM5N007_EMTOG|nr:4-(cytidine 5'-diphospho)-2-C-methyl-D-erythritol kinase [Emticicia oligotrophica]AFK02763.1 4-diphosphocytidyl-2-C-methyl-D-erythritolkinase [Emticicia oligotrophica DSM 17448]